MPLQWWTRLKKASISMSVSLLSVKPNNKSLSWDQFPRQAFDFHS
ncbi:hypothetical protein CHCC20490_0741 [Bacillus paralicheniformis]|nr:hypothetical protein CHCC5023_3276 [Bacillus paralicheniformis]TWJ75234.1 hypothetical protein CHCC5019_1905 [Bacillus paralicheniformis]TWN97878.1 hypothetical protein CHCC20490_0741 [Bacillus paralicheniformis]